MGKKNVYMHKIVIKQAGMENEIPITNLKPLLRNIFQEHCKNRAIQLSFESEMDTVLMDILEDTDEYLFARLSKKKRNNSMQKRNYQTYNIMDVLDPAEIGTSGVEWFTYCIMGYKHGILSIVNAKGAPNDRMLGRLFAKYNPQYELETHPIPNNDLISEMLDGKTPEITKISLSIARPDAQIMEQLFGFSESEIINSMGKKTNEMTIEIKPDIRGSLLNDKPLIIRIVELLRENHKKYEKVKVSGRPQKGDRIREYDLYEEYFKYQISVNEYKIEGGDKVERNKDELCGDYKSSLIGVYRKHKHVLQALSNRY